MFRLLVNEFDLCLFNDALRVCSDESKGSETGRLRQSLLNQINMLLMIANPSVKLMLEPPQLKLLRDSMKHFVELGSDLNIEVKQLVLTKRWRKVLKVFKNEGVVLQYILAS